MRFFTVHDAAREADLAELSQRSVAAATQRPGILASLASVGLSALAAGVAWCFVTVAVRFDTAFLIVPLGLTLGLFLRWQGFRGRWGAGCAALATLIAFAYAQYLFAAVRIAQNLGLPLRDALFKAGPALIGDIAWGNLHGREALLLAVASACAVLASSGRIPSRRIR